VSGSSRYQPSIIDGLPARVSGAWAREKLVYLAKYMAIFSGGMKYKWPARVYIDLMAGPGRCITEDSRDDFEGSPLLALACRDPFTDVLLVEESPAMVAALEQRVDGRATVILGDCNDPAIIGRIRDAMGPTRLGLAFADNLGLDVPLATLAALSKQRRVDLFITFQASDLKRNLRRALSGEDAERWTAFFGSADWRDVALDAERANLTPTDTATQLLDFYGERLGAIGYKHRTHSQRVMKNSRNVELYRLILAGKHERATEFFERVSKFDPWGQASLW
jgi:three-Cys-motif partner protein